MEATNNNKNGVNKMKKAISQKEFTKIFRNRNKDAYCPMLVGVSEWTECMRPASDCKKCVRLDMLTSFKISEAKS
jgi:hypothetical protein